MSKLRFINQNYSVKFRFLLNTNPSDFLLLKPIFLFDTQGPAFNEDDHKGHYPLYIKTTIFWEWYTLALIKNYQIRRGTHESCQSFVLRRSH